MANQTQNTGMSQAKQTWILVGTMLAGMVVAVIAVFAFMSNQQDAEIAKEVESAKLLQSIQDVVKQEATDISEIKDILREQNGRIGKNEQDIAVLFDREDYNR